MANAVQDKVNQREVITGHNAWVPNLAEDQMTRGQKIWSRLLPMRQTAKNSWDRFKLVSESYMSTEGLPWNTRRALAFKNVMENIPIYLDDDQIICGDWATAPMAAELVPEMNVNWIKDYLANNDPEEVRFGVSAFAPIESEEERQELLDMAEWWETRAVAHTCAKYFGKEYMDHEAVINEVGLWLYASYAEMNAPKGWCIAGFDRMVNKGCIGLLAEIEKSREKFYFVHNEEERDALYFLDAMKVALESIIVYARRYADLCEELASKETDPKRKEELLTMAETCRWVPEHPARNFREAVQSMFFADLGTFYDTTTQALGYGRVDQYLYPYYKADIDAGTLTEEEAIDILECLRVKIMERRGNLSPTLKKSATPESHFHNCVIGGVDKYGNDATNELSFLWLKAAQRTRTPHPTISVRWHPQIDRNLMHEAAETVKLGLGFPAFFCDNTAISWLMDRGASIHEARDYAIGGCVLHTLNGTGVGWPILMNMGRITEMAMCNGRLIEHDEQYGPETGELRDMKTLDDFMNAAKAQFLFHTKVSMRHVTFVRSHRNGTYDEVFMSTMVDDCIEVGKPMNAGGAKWKFGSQYILPIGLVDLCNSAAALDELVFRGDVDADTMIAALKANFVGYEDLQRRCMDAPKFGNDIDSVDSLMAMMYSWMEEEGAQEGLYGEKQAIAPHSLGFHADAGRPVAALPSGRPAYVALADGGCSPSQGTDNKGPLAVIRSAGKLDHTKIFGTLFNIRFLPSAMQTEQDLQNLVSLIETYFGEYGGSHIQFNVIDTETLKDAYDHPQNYTDLIVRVAGYSALWTELNENVWTDLIRRSENAW